MTELKVISVNISRKKGTVKKPVPLIDINQLGIFNDAHAGEWNRQVSLLGTESIMKFSKETGKKITSGEFAENITTQGMILSRARPLDRLVSGDLILEVTQIGKKCHGTSCAIFRETGNCVMPTDGIFCRVLNPGKLKPGDRLVYFSKTYQVKIITISDRASSGVYEDKSGPAAVHILTEFFTDQHLEFEISTQIIPDEAAQIENDLMNACNKDADIIITTGGTGIGPRDITPEVIKKLMDKEIPGIMDYIRLKYGAEKPGALLSRSIAGVKGKTLIFALPGSIRAVKEYLEEITKTLMHTIYMLQGLDLH
jgi:molybdopterin adenylyltransferase